MRAWASSAGGRTRLCPNRSVSPEPVCEPGQLRRLERFGDRERCADLAGREQVAGAAVHEPDEAEAGHRAADASN